MLFKTKTATVKWGKSSEVFTSKRLQASLPTISGQQFIKECEKVLREEISDIIGEQVPASEWLKLKTKYTFGFLTMEVPHYFRVMWNVVKEDIPTEEEMKK